jgi:hypothetical protein
MPGPVPARCTFPDDFLQDALDTVRRRTVAVQVVQRCRLVLLFQEGCNRALPRIVGEKWAVVAEVWT